MAIETRGMTVDDYLTYDEASEHTNEYIDGAIIPTAGGTGSHNLMVANTTIAFGIALADRDCAVYGSQMRVRIDAKRYVYPDLSVVCGEPEYEDDNEVSLLNPTVVAEVTSPESLTRDHVDKVAYYGAVPSIQGYLILDQQRVFAEWYSRAEEGWHLRQYAGLSDEIPLEALDCSLSLASVYRGIALEA